SAPSTRIHARLSMNQSVPGSVMVACMSSPLVRLNSSSELYFKLRFGAMSRAALTPISYAVLVLVGRGGAGPHDLVRMMRQGRIYESAAESQYYAEPKRLEQLGYLRSRRIPGQTHDRTHYSLTTKGVGALREWISERPKHPQLGADPIL